jgi:outer membrane receptor protein involved in Fe transport
MFRKTQVCTAVLAVVGGVSGLVVSGSAFAQTAAPAAAASETVTVTGSRVKRIELTSAPVAEVAAEEFRLSGTTRVEDLLNTLPQLAPSFDSFTVNPTTGFATADLRGLGTARTLVLVNGQRLQPGGIRSEARDLNTIPAAIIKRVDVLTGGASAVYGADAMAGVVNFILDTEFEGFSATGGWSAYQHKNRDSYIQGLMRARNFTFPEGDSGFDGQAKNIDLVWGSGFANGKGHAMAWLTWRENEELRQAARDYSSCALNAGGTACGGSGTSPIPNFLIDGPLITPVDRNGNGTIEASERRFNFAGARVGAGNVWTAGSPPAYNYAPINHYQRPDTRWNLGSSVKFEVNKHFRPYLDTLVSNTNTSVQIAESGTFFANDPAYSCTDPLVGTLCANLGIANVPTDPIQIYVGKRNTEGGPRISEIESTSFRAVAGVEGELGFMDWTYNVAYLYGRTTSNEISINDFVTTRIDDALRGCPAGSFDGCIAYNVWAANGSGVTAAAANAMAGVGIQTGRTATESLSVYVSGSTGIKLPTTTSEISFVLGTESRKDFYRTRSDSNRLSGNFAGLGGPDSPVDGELGVKEVFTELIIPVVRNMGLLKSFDIDTGYRQSSYERSGTANTYKLGFNANLGMVRVRGGYNRAIRAASVSDLFASSNIALWSGADPCAGATPEFTAAQCARTGVTAGQYGGINPSPANQYNQFIGGNPNLKPEQGDTVTLGLIINPMRSLTVSLDYWKIEITDAISTIGASTILRQCGLTGNPLLCSKVRRNASSGDLWLGSNPATSGLVENLTSNFGDRVWEGLDIAAFYNMNLMGGRFTANFSGSQTLKNKVAPLPGVSESATYDCAGVINDVCQTPEWRHRLGFRFNKDWWTVGATWRHVGEMDYILTNGAPGVQDRLVANNGGKLDAYNYLDLSAAIDIGKNFRLTAGVNNVMDKAPPMVGSTLSLNATAPGGYDQLGRYFFASVSAKF